MQPWNLFLDGLMKHKTHVAMRSGGRPLFLLVSHTMQQCCLSEMTQLLRDAFNNKLYESSFDTECPIAIGGISKAEGMDKKDACYFVTVYVAGMILCATVYGRS
ncbi:hypothetical protein MITS9504_00353 [Synechococcus sp. MIT S9504]|nr:hypothetical protein MITS9504_00353 [Synechococcus sp. MIT S9504]